MGCSTADETIKAARKAHRCSWCGERINPGETYKRWRFFHNGDAGTCKMHPECFDAMEDERRFEGGGYFEWMEGDNERPTTAPNAGVNRPRAEGETE